LNIIQMIRWVCSTRLSKKFLTLNQWKIAFHIYKIWLKKILLESDNCKWPWKTLKMTWIQKCGICKVLWLLWIEG
jgi:hypothetical protein